MSKADELLEGPPKFQWGAPFPTAIREIPYSSRQTVPAGPAHAPMPTIVALDTVAPAFGSSGLGRSCGLNHDAGAIE